MEQFERKVPYKEHDLHVICTHEPDGWAVDALEVIRNGVCRMLPDFDPFRFYRTGRAAEHAGLDEARRFVDRMLAGRCGNA